MIKDIDYAVHEKSHELTIELFDKIKHLEEQICRSLERAGVGQFYGGGQLRFVGKADALKSRILSILEKMDSVELNAGHTKFEEECRVSYAAREAFLALKPAEFVSLVEQASNQKLVRGQALQFNSRTIVLKAGAMMPVTHFKRLASIGRWDSKSQCFEYALPLAEDIRDRLLAAARALGRSKKQVTLADVANRAASRLAKSRSTNDKLDMDFAECREDFGLEYAIEMQKAGRLID